MYASDSQKLKDTPITISSPNVRHNIMTPIQSNIGHANVKNQVKSENESRLGRRTSTEYDNSITSRVIVIDESDSD